MSQDTNQTNDHLRTDNIFDEFANEDTKVELKQQESKKDIYDYLNITNKALVVFNIVLVGVLFVSFLYIYIQKQETKKEYSFLTPLCGIFLGDSSFGKGSCYSLYGYYESLNSNFQNLQKEYSLLITPLLGELYSIENFNYSKKVSFLLEGSSNRMKPLAILGEFDALKNAYSPIDKREIQCYNISFTQKNRMQISCDAYSSDWDTAIASLEGGVIKYEKEGTSLSRAISFIEYIQNVPGGSFSVISHTENLSNVSVQEGPYTNKTRFQLELEYKPQTLSL